MNSCFLSPPDRAFLEEARAILRKLGFVYKKTMAVPGRVDVAEQVHFLEQLKPFLAETEADEVVFFMDAVHPQHNSGPSIFDFSLLPPPP